MTPQSPNPEQKIITVWDEQTGKQVSGIVYPNDKYSFKLMGTNGEIIGVSDNSQLIIN